MNPRKKLFSCVAPVQHSEMIDRAIASGRSHHRMASPGLQIALALAIASHMLIPRDSAMLDTRALRPKLAGLTASAAGVK